MRFAARLLLSDGEGGASRPASVERSRVGNFAERVPTSIPRAREEVSTFSASMRRRDKKGNNSVRRKRGDAGFTRVERQAGDP